MIKEPTCVRNFYIMYMLINYLATDGKVLIIIYIDDDNNKVIKKFLIKKKKVIKISYSGHLVNQRENIYISSCF